jgi:hypothetical protein
LQQRLLSRAREREEEEKKNTIYKNESNKSQTAKATKSSDPSSLYKDERYIYSNTHWTLHHLPAY